MTTSLIGELTLGQFLPGPSAVAIAGAAGINAALPDIQARLAALAAFAPAPVDFSAQLTLANHMVTSIELSISLGITPPSIDAQIAAITALIEQLELAVTFVMGQLEIITDFQVLLSAPGAFAYHYTGRVDQLGAGMTGALAAGVPGGSPADACEALIVLTSIGATWTAMTQIFLTAPEGPE